MRTHASRDNVIPSHSPAKTVRTFFDRKSAFKDLFPLYFVRVLYIFVYSRFSLCLVPSPTMSMNTAGCFMHRGIGNVIAVKKNEKNTTRNERNIRIHTHSIPLQRKFLCLKHYKQSDLIV